MENIRESVKRFEKRVEAARKSILTRTEITYSFLDYASHFPEATASFYRLLPADLADEIKAMVALPLDQWKQRVTCTDSALLQSHLQLFLQQHASTITNAHPLTDRFPIKEVTPCPYCSKPLRTPAAKQCRFCKMDWHDDRNVFRKSVNG